MAQRPPIATRIPFLVGVVFFLVAGATGPMLEGTAPSRVGADVPRATQATFEFGLSVRDTSLEQLRLAEQKLGRKADLFLRFNLLSDRVDVSQLQDLVAAGYRVVITLEFWANRNPDPHYSLAAIAHGDLDKDIERWGQELASAGVPIILRPLHEMNGAWYPWGVYSGTNEVQDFVPAWRHIVDRIREAGASNVRFELCFSRYNVADARGSRLADGTRLRATDPWTSFWPGERYVDLVGVDVYNRPPDRWHQWESFDSLFAPSYERALSLPGRKPLVIQEVATTGKGGDKASWIRDAFASIRRQYPAITSVTWFDYSPVPGRDWTFDSDPASREALKEAVRP